MVVCFHRRDMVTVAGSCEPLDFVYATICASCSHAARWTRNQLAQEQLRRLVVELWRTFRRGGHRRAQHCLSLHLHLSAWVAGVDLSVHGGDVGKR
eukprot:m.135685 g.135685  ORF g.135685 m.135685 type:complete len:96 (+) comp16957_c1_seq1:168-455(+)